MSLPFEIVHKIDSTATISRYRIPHISNLYGCHKILFCWGGGEIKQNTILPQIIDTFVIKNADLTVKTIRTDIILKKNYAQKKLKYAPLCESIMLK